MFSGVGSRIARAFSSSSCFEIAASCSADDRAGCADRCSAGLALGLSQ
jgi:hypothetical protein